MLRRGDLVPQRRGQQQSLSPFGGIDDLFNPSAFLTQSPWQMMRRMQEDMDRLFGQFVSQSQGGTLSSASGAGGTGVAAWAPHIDVSETDKEFHIEADLPGVRQEDINIQVQDGMLVLSARMQQAQESSQDQQDQQDQQGQQQGADGQSAQSEGQKRQKGHKGENGQASSQQSQQSQQSQPLQRQYHQRERRFGYFERIMSLPPNVDEENIQADFRDGVLTLRLPKLQQIGQQGRRIPIGSGQSSEQSQMTAGAGTEDQTSQAG